MARPKKFEYDSVEFYDDILALAMQGLTDAEIATMLEDKFGEKLDPDTFGCMKNGNYIGWTEEENRIRSERLLRVLARGRNKMNGIVRGAYLKAALGGKKIKSKSVTKRKLRVEGVYTNDEEIQTTESESEMPPNIQALATWLYHHDPDWKKVERRQDEEEDLGNGSVDIRKWIQDNAE